MKFDWTLNLGHLLTIFTLVGGGFLAWTALEVQIQTVDARTADYTAVRDLANKDSSRIDALQTLVQNSVAANSQMLNSLAMAREDLASIKATVEALRHAPASP